jgi:hypothetical protein
MMMLASSVAVTVVVAAVVMVMSYFDEFGVIGIQPPSTLPLW